MADATEPTKKPRPAEHPLTPQAEPTTDPATERGERIDTGKTIQRGGKTEGKVPGAEEQPRNSV